MVLGLALENRQTLHELDIQRKTAEHEAERLRSSAMNQVRELKNKLNKEKENAEAMRTEAGLELAAAQAQKQGHGWYVWSAF